MVRRVVFGKLRLKFCHWSRKPNSSISKASTMLAGNENRRNIYTPFFRGNIKTPCWILNLFLSIYLFALFIYIYLSFSVPPPCMLYKRSFSFHPIHRRRSNQRHQWIIRKPNKPQSCWPTKCPTSSILKLEANRPLGVILGSIKSWRIVLS